MTLSYLDEKDIAIVHECLKCVASGNIIKHDWEFSSLFGLDVSEFLEIVQRWPDLDTSDERDFSAINNAMNNLLGYPHGMYDRWDEWMPYAKDDVRDAFSRLRAHHNRPGD